MGLDIVSTFSYPIQPQNAEFGLVVCSNVALCCPRRLVRRVGKSFLMIEVLDAYES